MELRGIDDFIIDCLESPGFVQEVLTRLTEFRLGWEGGVQSSVGDDWVNVPIISPKIYEEFALPCHKRIWETDGKGHLHTCGNMTELLPAMKLYPV